MLENSLLMKAKPKFNPTNGLLMHFEGADGSTTFVDECGNSLVNTGGAPSISSTQKYIGNSSGLFNAESLILAAPSVPLEFAGDYTVECFVYLTAYPGQFIPIVSYNADLTLRNFPLCLHLAGQGNIGLWMTGAFDNITLAGTGLVLNQWQHVASTRQGLNYRIFINGVMKFSQQAPVTSFKIDSILGWQTVQPVYKTTGYIDELRVNTTTSFYNANFVPPKVALSL